MLVVIPDSCGSRNTQKNKNEPKYLQTFKEIFYHKSPQNYTCITSVNFCKAGTLRNTQALWDSKIKEQHAT